MQWWSFRTCVVSQIHIRNLKNVSKTKICRFEESGVPLKSVEEYKTNGRTIPIWQTRRRYPPASGIESYTVYSLTSRLLSALHYLI